MRAYRAWVVTGLEDLLADWPRRDIAAFSRFLARFNEAIEGKEGRPWPREHGPAAR
jgi:hypothetical protein